MEKSKPESALQGALEHESVETASAKIRKKAKETVSLSRSLIAESHRLLERLKTRQQITGNRKAG